MFKNNKALNGHMRLHGGFDWTKRVSREREREMSAFGVGVRRGWGGSECVRYACILNCSFTINFSCVHVYGWWLVGVVVGGGCE